MIPPYPPPRPARQQKKKEKRKRGGSTEGDRIKHPEDYIIGATYYNSKTLEISQY